MNNVGKILHTKKKQKFKNEGEKMCSICNHIPCHSRCPNYKPPKADYYCSVCGEGILDGEKYIENLNNEYIHYDCIQSYRKLISWLGYDIKIMN